jgi:predicted transcriptional regulator
MEVRRWMKTPVHATKPLDSIAHARELMERHRINQLPVVVDGRLVGIVTCATRSRPCSIPPRDAHDRRYPPPIRTRFPWRW